MSNYFHPLHRSIPHCDLFTERGKLVVVWQALSGLKDSIDLKISDKEDSILFGCINLLEDIIPKIIEIERVIEFLEPREGSCD